MLLFLNILDDYYEYGIHRKETWEEGACKEAQEEIKQLEVLKRKSAAVSVELCVTIVKAAMYIMEADLWLNAVYILYTELSEQISCKSKINKNCSLNGEYCCI